MAKKSMGRVILFIVMGVMIGSLLGQLLGLVLPDGVVKEFFLKHTTLEVGPAPINVGLFSFTFGFKIILNIVGLIGIIVAIYLLRWY